MVAVILRAPCYVSAPNVHAVIGIMGNCFSHPLFLVFHRKPDRRSAQGPNLNAAVTLPPELVDKILEHIPSTRTGRQALVACALVATWWTGPSQRRLFSSVEIHGGNYEQWMNGVVLSRSKDHLLEHVRSLSHSRGIGCEVELRDLPSDSGQYLSALHNLHSLTFQSVRVERVTEEKFRTCFSAFRESLTSLSLDYLAVSFGAFVTLVDYFPNITTLQLGLLVLEPDKEPVPSLSRPLRGKLHVGCLQGGFSNFLNKFSKLDLEYEELVIDTASSSVETDLVERVLEIGTSTVKFLRLTTEHQCG